MNKLPRVDLSKFIESDRITSDVETCIVQGLIYFDCNTKKVKEYFNISEDIINRVIIKYMIQLTKISEFKIKNDKLDETINNAIDLYKDHIFEIKNMMDEKESKLLSDKITKNLNSILDRLVEIKETNAKTYDTNVNKLIDNLIRMKSLEIAEKGRDEGKDEYSENKDIVGVFLEEYENSEDKRKNNSAKPLEMYDRETKETKEFPSSSECARFLQCNESAVRYHMEHKSFYRNRYSFKRL